MKSFRTRYKPVGWRGDSHRHYLAAKGIKTKIKTKLYFADRYDAYNTLGASVGPNDAAKGNRMAKLVAIGHAKGFEDVQLTPSVLRQLAVNMSPSVREREVQEALMQLAEKVSKGRSNLPESTTGSVARDIEAYRGTGRSIENIDIPVMDVPEDQIMQQLPEQIPAQIPEQIPEETTTALESYDPEPTGQGQVVMTPSVTEMAPLGFGGSEIL